jgi:GNAT superfamily N-acetyltransferase
MKREGDPKEIEIRLQIDLDPETDFYYRQQFEIYHEPYLIWEWEVWEAILNTCEVYRIEVQGKYAGDTVLEERRRGTRYIVDFSLLPEFQGKGIGKTVLAEIRKRVRKLTAVTRKETLPFFLKSGFTLRRRLKDYYACGVDGYYIESIY